MRMSFSLDGADIEGEIVRRHLQMKRVECVAVASESATVDNVLEHIRNANIVHFGCHALFDPDNPENSGLVLSRSRKSTDGNSLYLRHDHGLSNSCENAVGEVLSLKRLWQSIDMFDCHFVNLAACSSGQVDWTDNSDEFYGLANGFLYSGARSVLVSLWPVHDWLSVVLSS